VDILVLLSEGKNPLHFFRSDGTKYVGCWATNRSWRFLDGWPPRVKEGRMSRFRMTCPRAASTCFLGNCHINFGNSWIVLLTVAPRKDGIVSG
jgi:hypothetical protein